MSFPIPTRAFYERDPAAARLRNVALEAAAALGGLLVGGRDPHLGQLLDANARLAQLGIEPGMHSFEPDDPDAEAKTGAIVTNPRIAAEYAAGFTRGAIDFFGLSDGGLTAVIEEHGKPHGETGEAVAFDMNAMGPNSQRLVYADLALRRIENLLDAGAGPSDLPA